MLGECNKGLYQFGLDFKNKGRVSQPKPDLIPNNTTGAKYVLT